MSDKPSDSLRLVDAPEPGHHQPTQATDLMQGAFVIPTYKILPADLELISSAATDLGLSVIDYAQLAPYLYAKWYMRKNGKP
jgi:hypothetical protein